MSAEEAWNFRLIGHDPAAAFGGGSLVEVRSGHAYVGAVGGSSFHGAEGFTVHDVRDPREPKKVFEFRAPPGIHMHKLRAVDPDFLYVNSERLAGERNARAGLFIFDISMPDQPREVGFYDMPGSGPHRFGVDNERKLAFFPNDAPGWNKRRDLDPRHRRSAQARGRQHLGPAVAEIGGRRHGQRPACRRKARARCTARR